MVLVVSAASEGKIPNTKAGWTLFIFIHLNDQTIVLNEQSKEQLKSKSNERTIKQSKE